MSFDLALSGLTDLIISGSRDLAGVSADALIEQRIRNRLKIPRGSWVLDESGTLGSLIYSYMGNPVKTFVSHLPDVIRMALADIDEIQINDIRITDADQLDPTWNSSQVLAVISWNYLPDLDIGDANLLNQTVSVPIATGGGD